MRMREGLKGSWDMNEQNFDGEANWSGAVNFRCMQMSLVMTMRFSFGDD